MISIYLRTLSSESIVVVRQCFDTEFIDKLCLHFLKFLIPHQTQSNVINKKNYRVEDTPA